MFLKIKKVCFIILFIHSLSFKGQTNFVKSILQLPDSLQQVFIKKEIAALYKSDTAKARKEVFSSIQKLSKPLQALVYKCAGFEEGRLKQFSYALKA